MLIGENKTLFELSAKQAAMRYITRLVGACLIMLLPFVYGFTGLRGIVLFSALLIVVAAQVFLREQLKYYEHGGAEPKKKDFALMVITVIANPFVLTLTVIAVIPGLVIGAVVYPVGLLKKHLK